jgi:uncharacterized protein (DUF2236 family)
MSLSVQAQRCAQPTEGTSGEQADYQALVPQLLPWVAGCKKLPAQ